MSAAPARRTSWTAAELMGTTFPEPRWAVPGLVAEGLTLLAGAPKLGKSWLSLNVSVAIATGGVALGRTPVAAGDVLYLALEDNGRRLQQRLRAVLGTSPAPERLHLATECDPLPEGADRIRAWLDAHPDARLVVVDVLGRIRPAAGASQDRYGADYSAAASLKALADEYGVALVVVHHTRKMASDDFLDAVSGTQGLAGAADAVLVLARSRGSAGAVLKVTGRDVPEAEHALDFDATTGTWRMLEGPAAVYELHPTRRAILEVLGEHEGLGPKAIAEQGNLDYEVVRKLVVKMSKAGDLDTDGRGRYFVPCNTVPSVPSVPCSLPLGNVGNGGNGEYRGAFPDDVLLDAGRGAL